MNRSGPTKSGESRTLEGVAVAVTALLAGHALADELEPIWRLISLLFAF